MMTFFKDIRRIGLLFCFAGFVAGKFALDRILPTLSDLPALLIEVRTPLFLGALAAAVFAYAKGRRIERAQAKAYAVLVGYALFTVAYALLPFPLAHKTDMFFGIGFLGLFAYLYDNEDRALVTWSLIGLSVVLIVAGFITTPHGQPLQFAGSAMTFLRVIALASFLVLFETKGFIRLGVCSLSGFALVASAQLSGIAVLLVCGLLYPIVLMMKGFDRRRVTANFACFFLGSLLGAMLMGAPLEDRLSFRLKENEMASALKDKAATESSVFPGGVYETDIVRNGVNETLKLPDFNNDTRVCIDDRSDRVKLFSTALYMAAQSKDRWGWGDKAYSMRLTRYGIPENHLYPHNILLEILVTRGPFFLIGFAALLYLSVLQGFAAAHRAPLATPFVAGMAYILLTGQWTGDYFDFRWFFILMVPPLVAAYGRTSKADL